MEANIDLNILPILLKAKLLISGVYRFIYSCVCDNNIFSLSLRSKEHMQRSPNVFARSAQVWLQPRAKFSRGPRSRSPNK